MTTTRKQYRQAATDSGLASSAIASGAPILAPTGNITGWRVATFRPDSITTVELLVSTPHGTDVVYEVPVTWTDGDWRVTFEGNDPGAGFRVTEANDTDDFTPFISRQTVTGSSSGSTGTRNNGETS